jgi:hypothetical protein
VRIEVIPAHLGVEVPPEAAIDWARWQALVEHVENVWREPDEGIWEVRGPRRHFTHSKVMAWVVFDRALGLAKHFGHDGPIENWERTVPKSTTRSASAATTQSAAPSPSTTARRSSTRAPW